MLKRKSYRNGCLNECQGKNIYKKYATRRFHERVRERERNTRDFSNKKYRSEVFPRGNGESYKATIRKTVAIPWRNLKGRCSDPQRRSPSLHPVPLPAHLPSLWQCQPTSPTSLTLQGKRTAEATFSIAKFLMLGVKDPLHVGQQLSFCRHGLQTKCPAWHCRIGGST